KAAHLTAETHHLGAELLARHRRDDYEVRAVVLDDRPRALHGLALLDDGHRGCRKESNDRLRVMLGRHPRGVPVRIAHHSAELGRRFPRAAALELLLPALRLVGGAHPRSSSRFACTILLLIASSA